MDKKQQKVLLMLAAGGALLYFFTKRGILQNNNPLLGDANEKRATLLEWANTAPVDERPEYITRVNAIAVSDLPVIHTLVTSYFPNNTPVPQTMQVVWDRYFTWNS